MTFDEVKQAVDKLGLKHVWLIRHGMSVRLMTDTPKLDWLIFANPRADSWQESAMNATFNEKVRDNPELSSKLDHALQIMNEFVDENNRQETIKNEKNQKFKRIKSRF